MPSHSGSLLAFASVLLHAFCDAVKLVTQQAQHNQIRHANLSWIS